MERPAVEVEPLLVHLAFAGGKDARPGHAEAIALEPQLLHQRHVFLVAVVVVAGDIARVAVVDVVGRVAKAVPDRLALAVLVPRPLDLVRGRGAAPEEAGWEGDLGHDPSLPPTLRLRSGRAYGHPSPSGRGA